MFDFDIESSSVAIAVADTQNDIFISKSAIFSQCFPGIEKKSDLLNHLSKKGEDGILVQRNVLIFNELYWELSIVENFGPFELYVVRNISNEFDVLTRLKASINTLKSTSQLFNDIFQQKLPIGIMVIDADYNVVFANNYLKKLFTIPTSANLKRCYNYRKRISPCKDCIFRNFKSDETKNKLVIDEREKKLTCSIFQIEDRYLLLYSDTTKEISLITEIKQQQADLQKANIKIAEQNDILKRLSDINIQIGILKDMEGILERITESIMDTFSSKKGAVLLKNEKGHIEYAYFSKEIESTEQEQLIAAAKQEKDRPIAYIAWQIKNKEQISGELFLYRPEKIVDESVMDLFLTQTGIYLENTKLQKKLEEAAQIDGLTGVFNRYYLDKKFKEEISLSERFDQPLSLILVDVNGLKEANDEIGHEAGDLLIKETATILKNNVSHSDFVFRLGGDEFVILLVDCPEYHLNIMVDMFKELQNDHFVSLEEHRIPLHFSIGGACSTSVEYDKLKDQADKAMYLDKEAYYKKHRKYR